MAYFHARACRPGERPAIEDLIKKVEALVLAAGSHVHRRATDKILEAEATARQG
jgi:hypothetical protein